MRPLKWAIAVIIFVLLVIIVTPLLWVMEVMDLIDITKEKIANKQKGA